MQQVRLQGENPLSNRRHPFWIVQCLLYHHIHDGHQVYELLDHRLGQVLRNFLRPAPS